MDIKFSTLIAAMLLAFLPSSIMAANGDSNESSNCDGLPSYTDLKSALDAAVATESSGLDLNMWATTVNRDGVVCAVAFSGATRGDQWPASRVISAQKANTANGLSLDGLALSTANLYSAVQPGGSLYGLQHSNPVDPTVAYGGDSNMYGQADDPMIGKKIGGVNVFGGGFGLYKENKIIGAVGVSGDTSCADHMIGWRVRNNLGLDELSGVNGVSGDNDRPDNIVYDITENTSGGTGVSEGGFGHPECLNTGDETQLPAVNTASES